MPSKRAAVYARYSTDLQHERSIDDQIALCRAYAARESLDVVAVYSDQARSGASLVNRDGIRDLMAAATGGQCDTIIVESLDRLSRDMEDLAGLYKRLNFSGIDLRAVHDGPVTTMLVGLRGLLGQLYREDTAHKIRRGQAGRVREGLSGGGLTYGYAPVPETPGRRRIVPAEAAIVRRIFASYIAGDAPRTIAGALNREHVAPPRGSRWNASTINGSGRRGSGILNNELYAGRLVWNKVRMIKDPATGRRVSRDNDPADWQRTAVPDLAIVTPEIFAAALARRQERAATPAPYRKPPKHMLSGLLRCHACGGGLTVYGRDRSGRVRIRCTTAVESGCCPNPPSFYLDVIERAVVALLHEELEHPDVLKTYVQEYHAERRRLADNAGQRRQAISRRLDDIAREAERAADMVVSGRGDADLFGRRTKQLAAERAELAAELATLGEAPAVVVLHPAALKRYAAQLADLARTIGRTFTLDDHTAATAIRSLIESVTVRHHDTRRGDVHVVIRGRLNDLVAPLKGERPPANVGSNGPPGGGTPRLAWGPAVAGERYGADPHIPFMLTSNTAPCTNFVGSTSGSAVARASGDHHRSP